MPSAKWLAASNALKSFNLATIATAVSLKTQAAAEGIAAISTKVLTGARALATTITGLFSMANIKAAATATAGGAANLFLALTTKAVAAGYIVATAAAAAFCAIPITWILIGVGAALVGVVYMLSQAGKYTAELSDKMETLRQKGDEQRQSDQVRMERLKQLSEKQQLSNAELAEAEKLTNTLTQKYGDFGASIDSAAGKLNLAADAQDRFNESMKRAAIGDLEAEIAEMQANLKELEKEDEALLSYWNHNLWSQISGRQEEAVKQIEANGDKAIAYRKKMQAARDRIKAINGGDQAAVTGQTEDTAGNVEAENQRRSASAQEAANAASRVEQIDAQLAKERRSELENEILEIQNLNDEYKSLIQTMLDFEKSKADNLQDKEKIAELEKKLQEADGIAAERIANAQAKAAEKFNRDVANLERRFADTEQGIQQKRDEQAQDRKIDDTLKTDKNAGIEMLQSMIEEYRAAAQAAKEQFQKELEVAQADGQITDEERNRLNNVQEGYAQAESMLDKYESKLRDAQEGTQKTAEDLKPQGAFLAAALDGILGGSSADRTAKATEAIAVNTKKTNEFLRKGSQTTFG